MSHLCPTCSETCYCMGDHSEILSGQPAYCKHCAEYEPDLSDFFKEVSTEEFQQLRNPAYKYLLP